MQHDVKLRTVHVNVNIKLSVDPSVKETVNEVGTNVGGLTILYFLLKKFI